MLGLSGKSQRRKSIDINKGVSEVSVPYAVDH
jgi:hypothetical protein